MLLTFSFRFLVLQPSEQAYGQTESKTPPPYQMSSHSDQRVCRRYTRTDVTIFKKDLATIYFASFSSDKISKWQK